MASKFVELMAQQGAAGIRNPVNRFLLNLPSSSPVAGVAGQQQAAAQPRPAQPAKQERKLNSMQEKLFNRLITGKDAGFSIPGPGILPGVAVRPEVRKMFEDVGGITGMDVTNLSPDEERGLMFILDPVWVAKRQPNGQG